jgi:small subunit ribosomal protein S2
MTDKKPKTKTKVTIPSLEEMLKAGVHFGHKPSKWNPKMAPYIFTVRNNIHVIDLEKTYQHLENAVEFCQSLKKENKIILFVGTKTAAKEIMKQAAEDTGVPYVTERWIGGTLTNFKSISKRLEHFRDLENKKKTGELKKYTKKERHDIDVKLGRLTQQFGGIKNLLKLPDAIFVIDVKHEKLAVKEALATKIPVIGTCDTNADPTDIKYPIASNDDASASLKLIVSTIVNSLK